MRGWVCTAAAATALAVSFAALGEQPASAGHEGVRTCGIVTKGSRDFRVRAQLFSCEKALRGAKRYLRRGTELSGFSCDEPAGRIEFFCKNGTKFYWAIRL
jgi:hypothetical protein